MSRSDEKVFDEFKDMKEITLSDIKILLMKNLKKIAVCSCAMFVFFVLFFLFFVVPNYVVDSTIEINNFQDSISLNPMSFMLGAQVSSSISSNEEILKSRSVSDRVIKDLKLDVFIAKKKNTMFFYVIDALFGNQGVTGCFYIKKFPELQNQSFDLKVEGDGYKISNGTSEQNCLWNSTCIVDKDEVLIDKMGDMAESEYTLQTRSIIEARTFLKKKLSIKSVMGTNNLFLQFSHENPYFGYLVLSKYIEVFEDINEKWNEEETVAKKNYISDVLNSVKKEIENKAQKLIVSQKENQIFLPSVQFEVAIKKIEFVKVELEKLELKEKLLTSVIKEMNNDKMESAAFSVFSDNVSMLELISAHNELIIKKDFMKDRFTDKHPEYLSVSHAVEESVKNILNTLKKERESVNNAKKIVQNSIDKIINEQKDFPQSVLESESLKKDLELTEKLYVALTTKLYESTLDKKTGVGPLKIIDPPDPIVLKDSPKFLLSIIIMLFLSLFGSFVTVFLFEVFREKVNGKDDVSKLFSGLPLYEVCEQNQESILKVQSFFDIILHNSKVICIIPTAQDFNSWEPQHKESVFSILFSLNEGVPFNEFVDLVNSDFILKHKRIVVKISDFEMDAIFQTKKLKDLIVKLNDRFNNIVINLPFLFPTNRYFELIGLSDKIFWQIQDGKTSLNTLNSVYNFIKLKGQEKNNMDIFLFYSKGKHS